MHNVSFSLILEATVAWTDQKLLTKWMKTTWESVDPAIDGLADEVERRGLDF